MEDIIETTFRFTIENIRNLKASTDSPFIKLGDFSWKIRAKTYSIPETPDKKYLSVFLCCNPSDSGNNGTESPDWSCDVLASLKIISQKFGCEDVCHQFSNEKIRSFSKGWGYNEFLDWSTLLDPTKGLEKDDSIILEAEIRYPFQKFPKDEEKEITDDLLIINLEKMLDNTDSHDVKIHCQGTQLSAHKAILSGRSPVFYAMFQSNMKESREASVDIVDVSPDAVKALLCWIYTGVLKIKDEPFALDILKLADMYELPNLMNTCQNILIGKINKKNIIQVLILADLVGAKELKKAAFNFIIKDASVVQTVEFKREVSKDLLVEILIMSTERVKIVPQFTRRLP